MTRLVDEFPRRRRIALDGVWKFRAAAKPGQRPPTPRTFKGSLAVPGAWEQSVEHARHRGYGWYQREFEVPADASVPLRLVFGAASHSARVWLDRREIGSHSGAHTRFEFVCPRVRPGAHRLTVLVDNTFGPHNPLTRADSDIFTWGGLTRSVYAEILPDPFIADAWALPRFEAGVWRLDCGLQMRSEDGAPMPTEAKVRFGGREVATLAVGKNGLAEGSVPLASVELWSPEDPRLYLVSMEAGGDVWRERIGFRTIEAKGRKILLNGEPIVLQGVNRHEFHPDFGPAVPPAVHLKDMEILERMGANFVRGSHYPNDPLFLDLCDENGILFWEELSHWGCTKEEMASDAFLSRSMLQAREMVRQHRHHASVAMWGMLNEAATDTKTGRSAVAALAKHFRALDSTRPVTYASNRVSRDICFDLVDIVSVNLYPGWYSGRLEDIEASAKRTLSTAKKRGGAKPIIFSEFGAGAIPGSRSFEMRKWTEDYQAELLARVIAFAQRSGDVSGAALWQYCDVRSSDDIWAKRPREYNNKGIVTAYREPKLAYYRVAEQFRQLWKSKSRG